VSGTAAPIAAVRDGRGATRPIGSAFGLSVESDIPLSGMRDADRERPLPSCRVELVGSDGVHAYWGDGEPAERMLEHTYSDGEVALAIDAGPAGYRIFSHGHGTYIVTPDGQRVLCAPPAGDPIKAQRVIVAQALPLAASLQGYEVFHASAVEIRGTAVGLIGASGSGKTTLALHLVARGLVMATDDVLVVDQAAAGVVTHPGPAVLHLTPTGAADPIAERVGQNVGTTDKLHVVVPAGLARALPLGACYFVTRGESEPDLRIERVTDPDPRLLMGSAFLSYQREPQRLLRMLDAAARIAARVPLFDLRVPSWVSPDELAARVEEHAAGEIRAC
jgi:hypothetical protein